MESQSAAPGYVVAIVRKDDMVLSAAGRDGPEDLSLVGGPVGPEDRRSPECRDYQVAYRALCRTVLEGAGVAVRKAQWLFERADGPDGKVAWCYEVREWEGEPRASWRRPEELLTEKCALREHNARVLRAAGIVR